MEHQKMPFYKTLKEDMASSKEKWKILIENINPSFQNNGEWTAFYFINSAPLQDFISHKLSKELMILLMLQF